MTANRPRLNAVDTAGGKLSFPEISSDEIVNQNNLTKEFVITYSDNNIVKETILDSSSSLILPVSKVSTKAETG